MSTTDNSNEAGFDKYFDYQQFADALEEVTYWHLAWYSQIMATLVFDKRSPAMNHHDCRFGRFIDGNNPPPGREAEFAEVDSLHRKMHELARALLCSHENDSQISAEAFDELAEIQTLFIGACNTLLRAVLVDGCALAART